MAEEYWKIPVTWQEAGTLLVSKKEYPRLADAMEYAKSDESPMPSGSYVDGSFELSIDDEDEVREVFNENMADADAKEYRICYIDGHSLRYTESTFIATSKDNAIDALYEKHGDFDHQIVFIYEDGSLIFERKGEK